MRISISSEVRQRIGLSFELYQPCITHYGYNTIPLMESVASFIGVKVNSIRQDRKHPQYRVRTNTVISNQKLRDYLLNYPLKGVKFLDFQDWNKVLYYFENKTH